MNFNRQKSISKINDFASKGIPFLFIGDFEGENCMIEALENLDEEEIKLDQTEKNLEEEEGKQKYS